MEFEYRKSNCMVYRWRHRSESQTTIRQTLPADRLNIFIQHIHSTKPTKPTSEAAQQSQPAKPFSKANKAIQLSRTTKPTS